MLDDLHPAHDNIDDKGMHTRTLSTMFPCSHRHAIDALHALILASCARGPPLRALDLGKIARVARIPQLRSGIGGFSRHFRGRQHSRRIVKRVAG